MCGGHTKPFLVMGRKQGRFNPEAPTQIFILRLFLEMGCDLGTTLFVLWNVTIKTIELLFSFGKATLLQKYLLNSDLDTVGQRQRVLSCQNWV